MAPSIPAARRSADYEQLCRFVGSRYCYFPTKATDWESAVSHYRVPAENASTKRTFVRVLEELLDELYDAHTHLTIHLSDSWRLPPHDVWAEWRDGKIVVTEVRSDSVAARAGLSVNTEIVGFNGGSIMQRVAARRPHFLLRPDPAAGHWALLSALSGRRGQGRELEVRHQNGARRVLRLPDEATPSPQHPLFVSHIIGVGIGYIRVSSFQTVGVVPAFDRVLEAHRASRGLVIDVRNNPGGDTRVTRPIMGRLVRNRVQYAWMNRRVGASLGKKWPEYIYSRGRWQYMQPIVILVNHWTMSAAEGFAMALEAVGRATVVGTRMAGLGAGVARTRLKYSGIEAQISAEPVYHVDGRPRSEFRPEQEVDLTVYSAKQIDPVLATGLAVLERKLSHTLLN